MTIRCLWLARIIPFPMSSGDRLYPGKLVQALASVGAQIRFLGLDGGEQQPEIANIDWVPISGEPNGQVRSLFSAMPLVAARYKTADFVKKLMKEIERSEAWDVLIIDQYGMGWILDLLPESFKKKTVIVYISQDHEESVMNSLWRNSKNSLHRRAFLFMNYLKTRAFENKIVTGADLVTAITEIDAELFEKHSGAAKTLVLSPGYSGDEAPARVIDASIQRRIILFGSLQWSAKQENLRLFLNAADEKLAANGIQVQIVGGIPESFSAEITARYKSVNVIGYVKDPSPYFAQSRLGVIAEPIGGGFKMKILDYIFGRVPILSLEECVAGLPTPVTDFVFTASSLPKLVDRLISIIDDDSALNDAQNGAFQTARTLFDWRERGMLFLTCLEQQVMSKKISAAT